MPHLLKIDIFAIIPLKELTQVGVCKHVVPQNFKAATDNTHVIIITVDDSISNESAKELISILTEPGNLIHQHIVLMASMTSILLDRLL